MSTLRELVAGAAKLVVDEDARMTDAQLAPIVARCARYILAHPRRGVSHLELREQLPEYRRLGNDNRLRVHVQLCKDPELAVLVDARERIFFYGRSHAPDGSFNIIDARRQQQAEAIGRAARWT